MKRRIPRKIKHTLGRIKRQAAKAPVGGAGKLPCTFSVDSPFQARLESRQLLVEGWIIPNDGAEVVAVRAINNEEVQELKHGLRRPDVAKAFSDNNAAMFSGFSGEFTANDGLVKIEVDFGKGFQEIYKLEVEYLPELLVRDLYNPDLAQNMAEHLNLMDNKKRMYYEEPSEGTYKRHKDDPRLVTFYLPQFHPIAENDSVWGEGFTEWTNVTGDTPRFVGHRQPFLPKDTGFYDLRLEQNIANQIDRAKKHGIYGFCFYYYWFSGKRLLEKPLDSFLKHTEWDFNFTICWANENWTKRWDGRDNEVIVAQKYAEEDPLKFIKDVEDILLDPRYIRENSKPVLVVFRASELKQPERYAQVWRDYFRKKHNTELHLVSIVSFEDKDPREYGFDAAVDFAPQSSFFKNDIFPDKRYPSIDVKDQLLDKNFTGTVADYRAIALNQSSYDYFKFPTYKSVTPSWDNDARKKGKGFVMVNESPDIYRQWLDNVLALETKRTKSPLIFINAWNEWAEGAVLEPTAHYGSAILNRTTETLAKYSYASANRSNFTPWSIKSVKSAKIAVVVHLYYTDRWEYIKEKLSLLDPKVYDLFVSINEKDKDFKAQVTAFKETATVEVVPNRGRDILPFIHILPKLKESGYKAVLKLHSKKTLHRDNGKDWFEDLVDSLIPDEDNVNKIVARITEKPELIGPSGHYISLRRFMGSNEGHLKTLLTRMNDGKVAKDILSNAFNGYFAGSMFWANLEVLDPLLKLYMLPEDFESENGQIDGTMAHAIERVISLLLHVNETKVTLYESSRSGLEPISKKTPLITYDYAE